MAMVDCYIWLSSWLHSAIFSQMCPQFFVVSVYTTHIGCECGRCWSRLGIICCHGWLLMMAGFNPPHQSNRQHPPPRLKCPATLLTSPARVPLEIDLPKHTHCARPESSIKRCIDAYNQVPLDTSCFFLRPSTPFQMTKLVLWLHSLGLHPFLCLF